MEAAELLTSLHDTNWLFSSPTAMAPPTDLQNPKTKKKIVIEVTINGDKKSFSSGLSIAELLSELKLNSRAIAVEINQQIKPRDTHETTRIQDGDMLEIVTLVGGG